MSQGVLQEVATRVIPRPLCVDLDGTLVKSDTLMDSLALLMRTRPADVLRTPFWLLRGKSRLKTEVTARISLDVNSLPYNQPLLQFLEEEKGKGRRLFLATGANGDLADRVAAFLGIFDGVLASDAKVNLTHRNKLNRLRQAFGDEGYDYIGDSLADLPLFEDAGSAMIANPSPVLRARLRTRGVRIQHEFRDRTSRSRTFLKAIRLHQWAKNILIFVPILLAHTFRLRVWEAALLAFLSFSLCASATYIVNDILDLQADRLHTRKRLRPFAAGDLAIPQGLAISALFFGGAIAIATVFLPAAFLTWLLVYLITTLSYSLYFRRVVLLDVILLSGLYTLRMLAGCAAARQTISPWLAAFGVFMFLSLAMVKRFSELQNARIGGRTLAAGRGYRPSDIEQIRSFGTASAYASVVVFASYIGAHEVTILYLHPARLWLVTPLMILWLSRIWLLASRGELNEDPVIFAVTNPTSLLIGAAVVVVAILGAV